MEKVNVLKVPERAAAEGARLALIDDLVDTGTTAREARRILPRRISPPSMPSRKAAVSSTPASARSPGDLVYFPWDTEPQYVMPLAHGQRKA